MAQQIMDAAGYPIPKRRKSRKPQSLSEIKKKEILLALSAFGGHRRKAAERLGISEATLYRWLSKCK
jgi:transcriptional regulator with PAS, ATPase and Fis domain